MWRRRHNMAQKLAILSGLIISATCTIIHHDPIPVILQLQQENSEPNYRFSYEVNDVHTGDIKSQQENRRGDVVSGQYSLLQPDGVRRTVDYRADELRGFRATVNNDGRAQVSVRENIRREPVRESPPRDIQPKELQEIREIPILRELPTVRDLQALNLHQTRDTQPINRDIDDTTDINISQTIQHWPDPRASNTISEINQQDPNLSNAIPRTNPTQAPPQLAISRTSIVQTIANNRHRSRNPWD